MRLNRQDEDGLAEEKPALSERQYLLRQYCSRANRTLNDLHLRDCVVYGPEVEEVAYRHSNT